MIVRQPAVSDRKSLEELRGRRSPRDKILSVIAVEDRNLGLDSPATRNSVLGSDTIAYLAMIPYRSAILSILLLAVVPRPAARAQASTPHAIVLHAARLLQVVKERANQGGIQVVERER